MSLLIRDLINLNGPSSWNLAGRIPASGTSFGCSVRIFLPFAEHRVPNLCLYIGTFHFNY